MHNQQPENFQALELELNPVKVKINDASFATQTSLPVENDKLTQQATEETIFHSVTILLAATIGTGVLMISNSMAASGVVWSVIQMIICGCLSYFSLVTLIQCSYKANAKTYQKIAFAAYGNWSRQLLNVFTFFANWGSTILYLKQITELVAEAAVTIFGGDNLPWWISNPESKPLAIIITTVFVYPLCLARQLRRLKYFTIANIFFVLFLCLVVANEGYDYQSVSRGFETAKMAVFSGVFTTFPSAIFSYTSHGNILGVYTELKRPSIRKMQRILKWTFLFVFVTHLIIGLIGYATFSSNISLLSEVHTANGIILLAYRYNLNGTLRSFPPLVLMGMLMMTFSIIISQPFNIRPAKEGLKSFVKTLLKIPQEEKVESFLERFLFVTVTLYSSVAIVLYTESAQLVLNLIGSSFLPVLCFIFPSAFYLKICKDTITIGEKRIHQAMLIFGFVFAAWSTTQNIIKGLSVYSK